MVLPLLDYMSKWLLEVATPWPFPRSKGQVAMFWLIWDMGRSNRSCNVETRFRDWKSESSLLHFVFCILVPSADCWRGLVDIDRQARDGDGWHGMPDRWGGCGAWEGRAGGWWALWQMTRDARRPRAKRPQRSAAVGFQPCRKCQHKYKDKYKCKYTMSPLEEISSQINQFKMVSRKDRRLPHRDLAFMAGSLNGRSSGPRFAKIAALSLCMKWARWFPISIRSPKTFVGIFWHSEDCFGIKILNWYSFYFWILIWNILSRDLLCIFSI